MKCCACRKDMVYLKDKDVYVCYECYRSWPEGKLGVSEIINSKIENEVKKIMNIIAPINIQSGDFIDVLLPKNKIISVIRDGKIIWETDWKWDDKK